MRLAKLRQYEVCPKCEQIDQLELRKTWNDGEVWCKRCHVFVRMFYVS